MNNLFGIGILLEIRDQVSQRLTRVSDSLEDVQTEADRTVQSVNQLNSVLRDGSSFQLSARESQALSSMLDGTSRSATSFQRRMQMMSNQLGGELSENTRLAYATMYALQSEVKKTSRQFGAYSLETMEARNRLTEFGLSLDDNTFKQVYMRSQLGLTGTQLQQQANSIKLNARMTKLMSSQTEILTQRMRGLQSAGVTPEMMLPPSTIGQFQLMNETIKASQSPIYKLNAGYRTLGNSVEKVIKGWSLQKVAIKMANGDMERYGLLVRGAQAGLMHLAIAFPLVGMAAVGMYSKIFSVAISTDEKLQKLIETVKGKLTKAFEPMLSIVRDVTEAVVKFVGNIADMIIKFNKAHPQCAKIIQGFALLLPAITLLLLPITMLNLGFNSLGVAINFVWGLIAPFVAGIGGASAMALTLVGALAGLTLAFTNLWEHNEKFRQSVSNVVEYIKSLAIGTFEKFKSVLQDLGKAFDEGGVIGVINRVNEMFQNLVKTATENLPKFIEKGAEIVVNILEGIATNLPKVYETYYNKYYKV